MRKVENYLYDIKKLLDQRNFEEAQILINRCSIDNLTVNEQAELLLYCGVCSFEIEGLDNAEEDYMKCITFCEKNEIDDWSTPYYELSLVYFQKYIYGKEKSNLEKSISFCQKALELSLDNSLTKKTSGFYTYCEDTPESYIQIAMHLGVLYQTLENYEKSIEILLLCKTVCRHMYNLYLLGQVYDELGTSYVLSGNQITGLYYYNKSLIAKSKNDNKRGQMITFQHMIQLLDENSIDKEQVKRITERCVEEQI